MILFVNTNQSHLDYHHRMKLLKTLLFSMLLITQADAQNLPTPAGEVNLYTSREPKLIKPLLDAFTRQTGVEVKTSFIKDGLIEKIRAEKDLSPADVIMTADIGNLVDLEQSGAFQAINSPLLLEAIPANLRSADNTWFGLSLRDRVLYADPSLKLTEFNYEDLADTKWAGKVCIRSGQHPYNIGLISAMLIRNGEEETEQWLKKVKANLARRATGGDRDVARDILGGICEIGIANAYYAAQMKTSKSGSDQRKWGDAIEVIRPTFKKSHATFVNISGAGVARFAPNRSNAIKLMEYLASDEGQKMYASADFEFPVRKDIPVDPMVNSFGPLTIDTLSLKEIAARRKQASELVERVKFDQ